MPKIWVPGTPIPQGSKNARVVAGRAILYDANERLHAWRKHVADTVSLSIEEYSNVFYNGAGLQFYFNRPKSHYTSTGKFTKNSPRMHQVKPDLDKLVRAILDALTGIAWKDDSHVCRIDAGKFWVSDPTEAPGVSIDLFI